MFFPEGQIRVHVYGHPVDMRKSYQGLYALTREGLGQDPLSGHLFVYISKRATQMKVLYFDRSGFCIWAKKLEAGCFISDWAQVHTREMDWTGLKLLLEGIEPARQRKRYRHVAEAKKSSSSGAHSLQLTHAERTVSNTIERSGDGFAEHHGAGGDRAIAGRDHRFSQAPTRVVQESDVRHQE